MIPVRVQYFAVLRERAGRSEEHLDTDARTVADLYEELLQRRALGLPRSLLRVAVNDDFCDWTRVLEAGDRVVFIPPVAGG